jgi:hypothetical protein
MVVTGLNDTDPTNTSIAVSNAPANRDQCIGFQPIYNSRFAGEAALRDDRTIETIPPLATVRALLDQLPPDTLQMLTCAVMRKLVASYHTLQAIPVSNGSDELLGYFVLPELADRALRPRTMELTAEQLAEFDRRANSPATTQPLEQVIAEMRNLVQARRTA